MTDAALREMVSSSGLSDEQTARVLRVLEGYLAELERGGRPDPDDLLARHPDLAELLKEYLDRLDLLHEAAVRFRVAPSPLSPCGRGVGGEGEAEDLGRLGDFQLLREVGRGGMGVVYEAEQMSLRRRVALKVLPLAATMDPRHLQRFQNEARAAASLHHEHIVPVYAVGSERGVHYYAMQFIDGQTLAGFLRERECGASAEQPTTAERSSPPAAETTVGATTGVTRRGDAAYFRRVAEWGIAAAEALEHAHGLGVVHRDVKPGNLMIDGQGKLWVTDFGLARTAADARLTMTGDVVGTLRYMSPEQALAKHGLVDHRTDVYSLGATLYKVLTGVPAVAGEDRQEILNRVAFEEPRPPRSLNRALPVDLETVVLKAMAKEPAERYATARELADDLRSWLEHRPIKARRPSLADRAGKWGWRHRRLVGVALGLLVLAVVALGVSTTLIADARSRADAESVARGIALGEKEEQRLAAEAAAGREKQEKEKAIEAMRYALGLARSQLPLAQRLIKDGNHFDARDLLRLMMAAVDAGLTYFPTEDEDYDEQRTLIALNLARALTATGESAEASRYYALVATRYEQLIEFGVARAAKEKTDVGEDGDWFEYLDSLIDDIYPVLREEQVHAGRMAEAEATCGKQLALLTRWKKVLIEDRGKQDYRATVSEVETELALIRLESNLPSIREAGVALGRTVLGRLDKVKQPGVLEFYTMARILVGLGAHYLQEGRQAEAEEAHKQSLKHLEHAVSRWPAHQWARYALAELLADCPDPRFRDPKRAREMVDKLVTEKGAVFEFHALRHLLDCRSGRASLTYREVNLPADTNLVTERFLSLISWKQEFDRKVVDRWAALDAISLYEFSQASSPIFLLKIASFRKGEFREMPRTISTRVQAFKDVSRWVDENRPRCDRLRRLRDETAAVLGVRQPPPTE